ncbi:hypothetical protein OHA21_43760 [Actinoplanes sp. NBC_00393]|uniref:hypothetical protein n=1 Tax=Actinoplanes sp. NBC_00393 TaxID=2975953 RepID=UPI002E1F57EA
MARSFANVPTSIWREEDFRALSREGQHAHFLLTTQPDISAAGVLSLNLKRWASKCAGLTPQDLWEAIVELEAQALAAVDLETEEVLLRSFVDDDRGYSNPKRRPVIRDAAGQVESDRLRRILAGELDRLGLPGAEWVGGLSDRHPDTASDRHPDTVSDSLSAPESPEDHPAESSQVDTVSDRQPDTVSPSERIVVKEVGTTPQSLFREPQSATRPPVASRASLTSLQGGRADVHEREPADAAPEPPSDRCRKHQNDEDPPPCGQCADARRRREAWDRQQHTAAAAAASAAARERAAATRAEIDACNLCDHRGRIDGRVCYHDQAAAARSERGAAAARAALAGRDTP